MSEILNLKNIDQYFYQGKNKINVLNNLDLTLSSSQKVAIIGSSGSGKTSLLNIISLMEKCNAQGRYVERPGARALKVLCNKTSSTEWRRGEARSAFTHFIIFLRKNNPPAYRMRFSRSRSDTAVPLP